MNDRWIVLALGLAAMWLSGCSVFYTPGMSELEELCEKDGGITIRKDLRVDGYYDDRLGTCNGCWLEIIRGGFDFIELKYTDPTPHYYLGRPGGYHRVFKAPKEDSRCNATIWKWDLSKKIGSGHYDRFFEDYCIASEPIDHPTAQYGYFSESEEWRVNEWYGSTIGRFHSEIRHLVTGKTINENVVYHLNPYPRSALSYGTVISCSSVLRRERFPQPIILPQNPPKDGNL